MKVNYFKVAALSLLLAGMATSCQKDSEMISSQELSQKSLAQENTILFFWIDGEEHYKKFESQEERNEFIRYLIRLTRKGHIITIESNNMPEYAPEEPNKEKFETTDEKEMLIWTIDMIAKGYNVEYEYNDANGTYVGTATLGETRTTTTAISTERDTVSM